jgi:peptide/nickel transport system permease protein
MLRYILSRLLLMIPTFLGILIINFAVLRLESDPLDAEAGMGGAKGGEGVSAERRASAGTKRYENLIDRRRRAGNDLPALVNLRGFLTKEDLVDRLRRAAPGSGLKDSERNKLEKETWQLGAPAVRPLAEVLADPALADLHGPASEAFSLCAYTTLYQADLESLGAERINAIRARNERLQKQVIVYEPAERGTRVSDPQAEAERAAMAELATQGDYARDRRWGAILLDTGFSTFVGRLFTGNLYSETKKRYVFELIAERWHVTFWLNITAVALAWLVAIPLGIRSARRQGTLEDKTTTNVLFLLWSLPSFFVGTMLLHLFCTAHGGGQPLFPNRGLSSEDALWYSTPGYLLDVLWHAFLPLVTLTYASFTSLSRYMRGNLLGELHADYARTARAKGCDGDRVVYGHCLRNSMITMITLAAGLLSELFAGALIVEMIFSINGLGWLLLDAAIQRDAPLVMGATVIQVSLLLVGILIADLLYGVADPRLRSRYG